MREDMKKRIDQVRGGEIPTGYNGKYSIFPKSWDERPLKAIAVKRNKKNVDNAVKIVMSNTAARGVIKQTDYFEKDIANEENIDTYYVVEENDFVYNPRISLLAPYGPIHANELGICGIVSPLYTVFRIDDSEGVYYQYIRHYFDSAQWNKYMYTIANYGARHDRMNITDNDFFNLPVPIPSKKEQVKIAEILNHCDKVIELKQQLIEEERNRKKWLMQNLLDPDSGVRLQGFSGEWKKYALNKVGKFSKGSGISNDDCLSGQSPCIKYGDIYMSYGEYFRTPVSITEEHIAALSPTAENGTLLFTASGEDRLEIGKCVAYLGEAPIAVGGDIVIFKVDVNRYDPMFLSYQQNTEALIKQKAAIAQGYSIVHLYGEQVKKLLIKVPPTIGEQIAISGILASSDNKITLLEQELIQWQQKKKALMQLLLTGLVRVTA